MSHEFPPKESSAMTRARELNRTNEKRLSECIESMSQEMEKSLQKLKIEGQSTMQFMKQLKSSSGISDSGAKEVDEDVSEIKVLLQPAPKMRFGLVDYKKKKLKELSQRLIVPSISSAAEGNPIPVRTVHPWTASTAKVLSQKKIMQIPRPTGRRRHSVESDEFSDEDEATPLHRVKKVAGQKRLKELVKRRSSLPVIRERKSTEDMLLPESSKDTKAYKKQILNKSKERRKSAE